MRNDWIITCHTVPSEIVAFLDETFFIVEKKRRVGEIKGITFEVRSREQNHTIPHVHAAYGEYSISIAIDDGRILSGNLPQKHEKSASAWVVEHKNELLSKWNNYAMSATSIQTQSLLNTDFDEE